MIRDFFIFCSGADPVILRKCYPGEKNKYAGIGGIVFFTAVMATISGSYALYTIFENTNMAIAFGIIWGLMIFNLDRYIIATMRKKGSLKEVRPEVPNDENQNDNQDPYNNLRYDYSELEGTKRNSEFLQALPRLILAVIIAIVISKPLEMKIFEKEIDQVLLEEKNQMKLESQEQIGLLFNPTIQNLNSEIDRLRTEISDKEKETNQLYQTFIEEAEGTAGSGLRGKGPVYKEKREKHDASLAELQAIKSNNTAKIAELDTQIADLTLEYNQSVDSSEPVIENVDGLMARIGALNELPSLPSTFILLLFLCIETAPIIAKLMSPRGQYDRLFEQFEREDEIYLKKKYLDREAELADHERLTELKIYETKKKNSTSYDFKKNNMNNNNGDLGNGGYVLNHNIQPKPQVPNGNETEFDKELRKNYEEKKMQSEKKWKEILGKEGIQTSTNEEQNGAQNTYADIEKLPMLTKTYEEEVTAYDQLTPYDVEWQTKDKEDRIEFRDVPGDTLNDKYTFLNSSDDSTNGIENNTNDLNGNNNNNGLNGTGKNGIEYGGDFVY